MPRVTPRTTEAASVEADLLRLLALGIKTPERWREAAHKASAALYHGHATPELRSAALSLLDLALSAGVDLSDPDAARLRRLLLSWGP